MIYHDLKQSIEVKVDEISDQKGIPKEKIPWHSVFCNICKIYRDFKTDVKYMPPRYAHEQDPDMIIWYVKSNHFANYLSSCHCLKQMYLLKKMNKSS